MSKIAIIGAGAGIGLLSVAQALAKGHSVIALSTDTSTIPNHPLLIKINGSATSVEDLKKVIQHVDAILVTIGTKKKKGTTLFSDTAKALISAMNKQNCKAPVLVISGFGVGESIKYTSILIKLVIKLFLKDQYNDKDIMENLFSKSDLNWEMVQPGMLTNGELTKRYKNSSTLEKGMKIGKISRADVAHYLINEAEKPQNLHLRVALTY